MSSQITKVQLSGITCSACQKVIGKRLKSISGVTDVKVELENGFTAIAANRKISNEVITDALSDTDYKIIADI